MLRCDPTAIRYRASISTKVFKPGSICSTKPSTLSETDTDNAYADSNQPLADARLAGRSAITSCRKLRMGFSASIVAPHETQRPLAGTGLLFTPHEGQMTDVGGFAAAMAP